MASPVFACVPPHPPILVPEVGRGEERSAHATLAAYGALREALAAGRGRGAAAHPCRAMSLGKRNKTG